MTTVLLGVGMFTGTILSPAAAAPVAAGLMAIGFMAFDGVQL